MDYPQILSPIINFLHCPTPQAWIDEARKPENLPLLLTDHMAVSYTHLGAAVANADCAHDPHPAHSLRPEPRRLAAVRHDPGGDGGGDRAEMCIRDRVEVVRHDALEARLDKA